MSLIIEENKSLKHLNTFGIDVKARYFAHCHTVSELQTLLSEWSSKPVFILGGGSNIVFTKNVDGLVIQNSILGIEKINEDDEQVLIKAGAGENWHQFVLYCIENNYAGVENLSLIPGTVGAAPIQNIGAYGVELKDVFENAAYIKMGSGIGNRESVIHNHECHFGYRDSIFKNDLKNQAIITHVTFKLNKKPIFHTEYGAIKELIKDKSLSIKTISDAVIKIRQEKLPDPKVIGNAGSFFKNPIVDENFFLAIQKKYPKIPHFSEKNEKVKIPAAWLIEQCGLKGKRFGNVGVHEYQALVLVNYGTGSGADIIQLSEHIQKTVREKFEIELTTEVNVY